MGRVFLERWQCEATLLYLKYQSPYICDPPNLAFGKKGKFPFRLKPWQHPLGQFSLSSDELSFGGMRPKSMTVQWNIIPMFCVNPSFSALSVVPNFLCPHDMAASALRHWSKHILPAEGSWPGTMQKGTINGEYHVPLCLCLNPSQGELPRR